MNLHQVNFILLKYVLYNGKREFQVAVPTIVLLYQMSFIFQQDSSSEIQNSFFDEIRIELH